MLTDTYTCGFYLKLEIVSRAKDLQDTLRRSERECRKRCLLPSLPSTRSPRRLRAAYPSRSWVEVHLDQRTERLVSIFFDVPRTWKWRSNGFDLVIRYAIEPAMPATLPVAPQPPQRGQKSVKSCSGVKVWGNRKSARVVLTPPPICWWPGSFDIFFTNPHLHATFLSLFADHIDRQEDQSSISLWRKRSR